MTRKIKIVAVRNEEPLVRLYVLALIALARQQQDEAAAAHRQPQSEDRHD